MAATIAFQKVIPRQTHITHILWATDSRSLLDALSGNTTKASGITQHLWRTITTWLDKGTRITAIWTPSHCGISENERADKLANEAVQKSASEHRLNSTSFEVIRSSAKVRKTPHLVYINHTALTETVNITQRRAEVLLNQLLANCSPLFRTFRTSEKYEPKCMKCNLNVKETVEHLFQRCPGRSRNCRKHLGSISRASLDEICAKFPIETLGFLQDEGLLDGPGNRIVASHN